MDLHLTADGVPVVIHEPAVDGATDGTVPIRRMTLDQIELLGALGSTTQAG